jgi:uncharacterized zinc-type alcohol dehydrogenase-like protein
MYPVVPGHELVGIVEEIGSDVTRVKVGDKVGMGCLCDSCFKCKPCKDGEDQYCLVASWCHVYNDTKKYGHIGGNQDTQTLGGYSEKQTCHEKFVIKLPENLDLKAVGPLLCAGVTMYDPLRHWGFTKGDKKTIGVIGVGGLGTMGLKIASALGHRVVAISHTNKKAELAKSKGADAYYNYTDKETAIAEEDLCDIILNTIPVDHQVGDLLGYLAWNGVIVQLGVNLGVHNVSHVPLIFGRKSIAGSLIGGIESTEECL